MYTCDIIEIETENSKIELYFNNAFPRTLENYLFADNDDLVIPSENGSFMIYST